MSNCKSWKIRPVLLFALLATVAAAQTKNQATVQFVARGMQPTLQDKIQGDDHERSIFGHIFMIISIPTAHGPKEEAYGFYSKASLTPVNKNGTVSESIQNWKLQIKGPGLAKSEFRCGVKDDCNVKTDYDRKELKRFSESVDSVRIPITEDQRLKIIGEVDIWNHKEYNLATQNCVHFVSTVVEDLGYKSPNRAQPPVMYLKALKKNIVAEDQRREIEHAQIQQRATKEAARQNKNNDCESGIFQETNPNFIWNLTFDGDDLTGQRTDGKCYLRLSRTGETWSGFGTCGQQHLNLVMRANDGCTQLTSNLAIFCPILNRK